MKIKDEDLNIYGKALKVIFKKLSKNAGKQVVLDPQTFKVSYKEN